MVDFRNIEKALRTAIYDLQDRLTRCGQLRPAKVMAVLYSAAIAQAHRF